MGIFSHWNEDEDDRPMFGPKPGSWWTSSKKDPRFNLSGHDRVGGFMCPPAADEAIRAKERELGVKAPDDLEYGYMKD